MLNHALATGLTPLGVHLKREDVIVYLDGKVEIAMKVRTVRIFSLNHTKAGCNKARSPMHASKHPILILFSACGKGRYGWKCDLRCNCTAPLHQDGVCNHINGTCFCAEGRYGKFCNESK